MNAPACQNNSIQLQKSASSSIASFSPEQINVLKNSIAKGASNEELELFLYTSKRTGLDPFSRQIYLIKRWDSSLKKEVATTQTSIDGFRAIASRDSEYAGQTTTLYAGKDGEWVELWTDDQPPFAAKVGIYRKNFGEPTFAIAKWNSYVQKNKDGSTGKMWQKFPDTMLGKCAEAQALRKAFPLNLSGLYTHDEMAQANNEVIEAQQVKEETKQIVENIEPKKEASTIKKVPAQVAQAQKSLDKKEKPIEAEIVNDEVVYNGCDAHKEQFRAYIRELASIKAMPKTNDVEIKAITTIYHIYNDRCMGVPLSFLKEHIQNLEKDFTVTHQKNSSAA